MKHKMFLIMAAIFVVAFTADSIAQLTKIWEIKNFSESVEALSPHAKLGHLGGFLIDLTNGNIIDTKVNPEGFHLTYSGDRYFVSNRQEKTMKVYDRYTKEFIQDLEYKQTTNGSITAPDESTMFVYEHNTHTLQFWNVYTNELTDSYKIPGTPEISTFSVGVKPAFSHDGRYFGFSFKAIHNPTAFNFMVYDRVAREIVFFQTLPISQYSFVHSFMHTSNQLAYGEVVKLEGDDKKYSYIRIFDLDKREVVRNVRVGEESNDISNLTIRNDDKYILYIPYKSQNTLFFYDYELSRISDFSYGPISAPIIADELGFVTKPMMGYAFDWTVGVEDENPVDDDIILYPNPSTNQVNLNIDEKYFHGQWQIIDIQGRTILQGIILPEPNLQINVNMLQPQTYNLRIQKDNFITTFKLVKL